MGNHGASGRGESAEGRHVVQPARSLLSESLRRVEAEIAAGHPDLALTRCQELQTLYPRALAVHRVLGEVYLALRKPREALGALDRALSGDPEDARACCARAIVHQMHGDSLAALAWYRRACDIRPDDGVLRSTYAELAAHLSQPPYRPTPVGLARLYLRGGLYTHAIREWDLLATEYPDLLEAQVGLAESLWRAQQPRQAAERCRRILTNAPSCVKAALLLAVMAHDSGNEAEAQRLLQRTAELDPDQRIAQALFADRLAIGDLGLRRLLFDDEQASAASAPGSGPLAGSASTGRSVSRSLVRPLTGRLSERAAGSSASGALSQPASAPPLAPLPAHASPLPPESRRVFSEAENMIWGQEETDRHPRATADPTSEPSPAAGSAPPPQPLVPPALAEQGTAMDESEVRQALNWVHWLQAQGARAHPGTLPASSSPTARARPEAASAASTAGSGPLPPPRPEELRSMFAELAPHPGESGRDVVEADIAASAPAGEDGAAAEPVGASEPESSRVTEGKVEHGPWYELPTEHAPDFSGPGDEGERWSESGAVAAGWVPEASLPEDLARLRDDAAAPPANGAADATLEELERHFTASGFEAFEPRPGALAELAETPAVPSATPAPAAEPLPAPDDYPARLERARQLRRDGRTDEALVEYRAVLKNAPDLLDAVLDELGEMLAAMPEHPDVHRLLGDARIRQGDYLGALESYNRAVALTPANEY